MAPIPSHALALILALTAASAPASAQISDSASPPGDFGALAPADVAALKQVFLAGKPLPSVDPAAQDDLYRAAASVQAGRLEDEDDDAFAARVQNVAGQFGLSDEEAAQAAQVYRNRRGGGNPAQRTPEQVGVDPGALGKATDTRGIDSGRVESRVKSMAAGLGASHKDDLSGPGGSEAEARTAEFAAETPPGAPKGPPGAEAAAIIRDLNARAAGGKGFVAKGVPEPETGDVLHAMGSLDVAPAPTLAMRARALWSGQPQTVAQDLAAVRANAASLQLPADGHVGLASSQADLDSFLAWVKTVKDPDLPKIGYGVLKPGEIGRYERGVLSKGSITLNLSIQDAEPEARAAVLFHELYHYWDKEVARNPYGNVSYGYIDPAHLPEHEYDAYYLTAVMWQQAKSQGASSALARFLDNLPTDRGKVPALVDENVKVLPK